MKFPVDKTGVVQPAKDTNLNIGAMFQLVGEKDNTPGLGGGKKEPVARRNRHSGK